MAFVNLPPHEQARLNQQRAERAELESVDPVTRYRARERAFNRNMAQVSAAMVQQAQDNAKAMERREREIQRYEQEYFKSKYNQI